MDSKSNITPGPWSDHVGTFDGNPMGSVHGPKGSNEFSPVCMVAGPDAKANARAISRLPDLLEAAEKIDQEVYGEDTGEPERYKFEKSYPILADLISDLRTILLSIKEGKE